jgi:TetR/AcrR family transcriptional regulator, regulator of autoinduction and epiphytic fitness
MPWSLRQNEPMEEGETTPCWQDPRIERTRRVVLESAIELLIEGGYSAVTMEAVAAASGVAKSTIYRHWPNRSALINDAFHELKPTAPLPVGGDVRARITVLLEHLARQLVSSTWSSCLPALIDAAERDPEARELHSGLARTGRQVLVDLLAEGVRTGELPPDTDVGLLAEAMAGAIVLRRLMATEPFDPSEVPHLVDQLWPTTAAEAAAPRAATGTS